MVSKKELLLKSIRELLALNVSDKEIVVDLKEVGIGEEQAKALIEKAKQLGRSEPAAEPSDEADFLSSATAAKKDSKRVSPEERAKEVELEREQATEDLAAEAVEVEEEPKEEPEEIAEGLGFGDEPGEKKPAKGKPGKKPPFASIDAPLLDIFEKKYSDSQDAPASFKEVFKSREEPRLVEDIQVSQLWEKGILATVNQKIAEMQDLRRDLDAVLDRKVADANKRETARVRVLFDSQRALLVSKVNSELEAKAKGFAEMIELKLRELRAINKQIAFQTEALKEMQRNSKADVEVISKKFEEADNLKEHILSSLNGELINIRTESKSLVDQMNKKLADMDERINKTLQLENQVVEGLVKEAERRVAGLLEAKSIEFSNESKGRVQDLQELRDSFSEIQKAELANTEENFGKTVSSLESRVDKKLEALDSLQKQISVDFRPEKFRQTMQELNEFKAQFVDAIKQNVEKFNEGIKRLNQQSQVIERQFMLRSEKIDKKIVELDAFEKSFAKEMGLSLEKMTKKEKKKS